MQTLVIAIIKLLAEIHTSQIKAPLIVGFDIPSAGEVGPDRHHVQAHFAFGVGVSHGRIRLGKRQSEDKLNLVAVHDARPACKGVGAGAVQEAVHVYFSTGETVPTGTQALSDQFAVHVNSIGKMFQILSIFFFFKKHVFFCFFPVFKLQDQGFGNSNVWL